MMRALCIACVLLSSGVAQAQQAEEELGSPTPTAAPRVLADMRLGREETVAPTMFGVWGSAGIFSGNLGNDSATVSMFDLGLRIGLGTDAALTVDWGLAVAATRVRGEYVTTMTNTPYDVSTERVEARNADFAFAWTPLVSSTMRVHAGLGFAIPIAAGAQAPATSTDTAARIEASRLVHDVYLAANSGWYAWRYRAERAAIFVPLGFAIELAPETVLSFEGAAALSFPILGGSDNSLFGDAMLAAEIGSEVVRNLRIGGRLSVAALNLGVGTFGVQPALEPWVRYRVDSVSLLLRANLPFAGRYGIGSDFPGWGVQLGASVDVE